MFGYPMLPYGAMLKELIFAPDTVLDLGCGPGVCSLLIAPWCKRVLALDNDAQGLNWLHDSMLKHNIDNIEIINDSWPLQQPLQVDVIIALHVYGALSSLESVKLLYTMAKKGGFIACNAPQDSCMEPFIALKKALGIKPRSEQCSNGCWIKGVLEAFGADVTCQKVTYDFGQPLDTMEEAVRFMRWQVGATDTDDDIIRKYAELYVSEQNGKIIVPITKQGCAIIYEK